MKEKHHVFWKQTMGKEILLFWGIQVMSYIETTEGLPVD